jgi:hypothetical protein
MKKISFFAISVICLLSACTSSHVNAKRINQAAFPASFNDPNCILLIQKRTSGINARGMNNYLRRAFQKHYSGKFEMASYKEINNDPKYNDKKIYHFVLTDQVWSSSQTIRTTTSTGTTFDYNNSYSLDYRIHDRIEDKTYPEIGVYSSVPARAMNKVAAVLDKQLHR